MPDPYLIEDAIRVRLLTQTAVTAIVGQRIRPGVLDEGDALPAIVITVDGEEQQNDLTGNGGLVRATVFVHAIASSHRQARILSKQIAFNGADPGSGLAGFTSDVIQECSLPEEGYTPVPENDDGDGWRHVITAAYELFYTAPTADQGD